MGEVSDILKPLKHLTRPFPETAVKRVIARREETVPHLISALERVAKSPADEIAGDYMLHIYALFLLGEFREFGGYLPAVKLARHPRAEALLGDVVTVGLSEAFASMSGGEPGPIQSLIEDREANEWARGAGLRALGAMYHGGMVSREDFSGYLGELFSGKLERDPSHAWDMLVTLCTDFRLAEHLAAIRTTFREDLADPGFEPLDDIEERILFEELDEFDMREYRLIDSAIGEMSWRGSFDAEEKRGWVNMREQQKKRKEAPWTSAYAPLRREALKVGRNDPCPCGSGKKYKKCCLT